MANKPAKKQVWVSRQVCITCGIDKPRDAYWKQASKRSGLFAECKACARRRNATWHTDNASDRIPKIVANVKRQRLRNPMSTLLNGARHRAKILGMEFTLALSDVPIPEFCPVLGIRLESGLGQGRPKWDRDRSPSLDRIDNDRGYTPDNVIVVSHKANRLKSNATVDDLVAVASFYRRLESERARKGAGGGSNSSLERLPTNVSEVLVAAEKEERPMSARNCAFGRGKGVLPSLQLGDDFR